MAEPTGSATRRDDPDAGSASELGYGPSAVREDHRYTVSARILVDDRLAG